MKKLIMILMGVLLLVSCQSTLDEKNITWNDNTKGYVIDDMDPLYYDGKTVPESLVFQKDGKKGVIDENLKVLVEANYDDIKKDIWKSGIYAVKVKERWGYIKSNGEPITETIYLSAEEMQDGLALVETNDASMFLNPEGKNAFGDKTWKFARPFQNGLAAVAKSDNGMQLISRDGTEVKTSGKNYLTLPNRVIEYSGDAFDILDRDFKRITGFNGVAYAFTAYDELFQHDAYFISRDAQTMLFVDEKGQALSEAQVSWMHSISADELFYLQDNGKGFIYNANTKKIREFGPLNTEQVQDKYAVVRGDDGLAYLYDMSGKKVFETGYSNIRLTKSMIVFEKDGRLGTLRK